MQEHAFEQTLITLLDTSKKKCSSFLVQKLIPDLHLECSKRAKSGDGTCTYTIGNYTIWDNFQRVVRETTVVNLKLYHFLVYYKPL